MARQQHDREDMLAEAKALVERVSVQLSGCDELVLAGFRRDGAASLYYGGERAYHFTTDNKLRRALVDTRLYKADRGRLASLTRHRRPDAVELVRHDLSDDEQRVFLAELKAQLDRLRVALANGDCRMVAQVPPNSMVLNRARDWLAGLRAPLAVADSPRAG